MIKTAKHRIELEPEAIPHREGAIRMFHDKATKANHEVQNLLPLGLIQSLTHHGSVELSW